MAKYQGLNNHQESMDDKAEAEPKNTVAKYHHQDDNLTTRMHSSKMRTIHCSGHREGGGGCLPACIEVDTPPSVDRILDTRL